MIGRGEPRGEGPVGGSRRRPDAKAGERHDDSADPGGRRQARTNAAAHMARPDAAADMARTHVAADMARTNAAAHAARHPSL